MQRRAATAYKAIRSKDYDRLRDIFLALPETEWLKLAACLKVEGVANGHALVSLTIQGRDLLAEVLEFEAKL